MTAPDPGFVIATGAATLRAAIAGNLTVDALVKSALADAIAYCRAWRHFTPADCPDCAFGDNGRVTMVCSAHAADEHRAEQYTLMLGVLTGNRPRPVPPAPTVADSLAYNRTRDSGGSGPGLDPLRPHSTATGDQP